MKRYVNDSLPKINEKATKKAVERELFTYRDLLITLPDYSLPKITASYTLSPPSQTNEFHSSTEKSALERIEFEQYRNGFLERINNAVNTLKESERHIIINKYLQYEIGYDLEIWNDLGVGKTKYYEIKGKAMLRLAFALQIEVYKRNEVKSA